MQIRAQQGILRYLRSFEIDSTVETATEAKLWKLIQQQQDEIRVLTNKLVAKDINEFYALKNQEPDGPDGPYVNDSMEAERWEESLRKSGFSDEEIEIARVGE